MEDHYAVTNGPVFSDYVVPARKPFLSGKDGAVVADPEPGETSPAYSGIRLWTLKNGKNMEAELVMELGLKTVLKTANGKQLKIPTSELSSSDLDYLELKAPPTLGLTLQKEEDRFRFTDVISAAVPPKITELTLGVKIEQLNKKSYTRALTVELFSIAAEIDGDNFVLLDRQKETFYLSEENGRSHVLWGEEAKLRDYYDWEKNRRGLKFKGHMIVIIDERGEIIAQNITNDWMLDIINPLRAFPVGRHFDKTGTRVYPPRARPIMSLW
jgi:hypothetical protein